MKKWDTLDWYEFLATPAHGWLWIVAKLCGGTFSCGPVNNDEEEDASSSS